MRDIHVNSAVAAALVAVGAAGSFPAFAQDMSAEAAPADRGEAQEIIVTAQKRSERLSDVPISITAATAEQLDRVRISDPSDLGKIVPGFSYQRNTAGTPIFALRGVGFFDDAFGVAPAVSIYVDQAPLPFTIMGQGAALDIERVEVLKGPQGTLFGQNSTGGAINYIATRPTEDRRMGFDLTVARFNEVDVRGFVSGPLAEGVRVRVAARRQYADAWQISETRPDDRLGRKELYQGRVLIDWDATSALKFQFNANGWVNRSETAANQFVRVRVQNPAGPRDTIDALTGRPPKPENPRLADWDAGRDYQQNSRQYQFALRGDLELGSDITLTSISSYAKFRTLMPIDVDGTDAPGYFFTRRARLRTVSQELRIAADLGGLKLTTGANYQDDDTAEANDTFSMSSISNVGPLRFATFIYDLQQQVKTYAAFASAEVPITSTLTAEGGLRYTNQDRNGQGCLRDGGDGMLAAAIALIPTGFGLPYAPAPAGECVSLDPNGLRVDNIRGSLDEDNLSWRAGLKWQPDRDLMAYGNVTKGYKAGGFTTISAVFTPQFSPVVQESLLSYELGAKASLFDRRIDLAASIFTYQYNNKQILGIESLDPFGALPILVNIPRSKADGAEVSIAARPVSGLSVSASANYLKSRVTRSFMSQDPDGNAIDLKGEAFPNAPKWQLIGDANYQFDVASDIRATIGANVSYRTSAKSAFGTNPIYRIPSYAIVGLSAGIESADQRWKASVFGTNIFNKLYLTNVASVTDVTFRSVGQPATYGITLGTRF